MRGTDGRRNAVKERLGGDVIEREVTAADLERYKAIHEKFVAARK